MVELPESEVRLDEAAFLVAMHAHPDLDLDGRGETQDRAGFRPDFLLPSPPRRIVDRMLANLQRSLFQRDPASVAWVLRLRLRIPGLTPPQRAELAGLLGHVGSFSEAARELDRLARELPGDGGSQATRAAARLRARAN